MSLTISFKFLNVLIFSVYIGYRMAYTVEKLLWDAQTLVSRLKEHDCTADILISQTQTLQKRIDGMKEVSAVMHI